ncbi:MAG: response regulator [Myxococcaceae bacterium]
MKLEGGVPSRRARETSDAARLVRSFLWIILSGFVLYVVLEIWINPHAMRRYVVQAALAIAIIGAMMWMVRLGRARLAAVVCIVWAWAFFTVNAYTGGGIRGSASIGYLVTVVTAGLLIGRGAAAVTAVASILTGLGLVVLEAQGKLPASAASSSPLDFWANLSLFCAATVALQVLAARILRASEERYRLLVDRARDAIFTLTPEGAFSSVNPAFESMTGWRTADSIGKPFVEVIATPEDQRTWAAFLAAPDAKQRHSLELRVRKRDGGTVDLDVNLAVSRDSTVATLGIARDVTERKEEEQKRARLESQLRQSQKMEAVGTLAGGIAHDFNNVLTAIIGHAQLLQDDAPAGSKLQESSGEILKAGARAGDVVRQLLTFARTNVHERRVIRLQTVLREALQLMRASVPTSVEMEMKVDAAAPPVLADPTQMHQVIVNLVANAAGAMRERGGRLTVLLETLAIGEPPSASSPALPAGRYVRVAVTDTGHGMDARVLERIFEPFFTTKPDGEGTGLGLAVVHSIIQDHEGHINVKSEPGVGTTVDVFLRALEGDHAPLSPRPLEAVMRGHGERLLIIDDEPAIARVLAEQLERLGYTVTTATDPEEALEVLTEDPTDFDLAITDLQMPRMDGVQLAARLAAVRPSLPVVLITGNRMSVPSTVMRAAGVREVVDKPFQIRELCRAIRTALDGPPEPGAAEFADAGPSAPKS